MDEKDRPKPIEDYRTAFLWTALGLVIIALMAVWAAWGFLAMMIVGWVADKVILMRPLSGLRIWWPPRP